eukprot:scaffold4876_cov177-Amphora_coffeaeformis.AAC.1
MSSTYQDHVAVFYLSNTRGQNLDATHHSAVNISKTQTIFVQTRTETVSRLKEHVRGRRGCGITVFIVLLLP